MHRSGQTRACSPRSHSSYVPLSAAPPQASVDKLEARVQDEARTRAALEEDLQVCVVVCMCDGAQAGMKGCKLAWFREAQAGTLHCVRPHLHPALKLMKKQRCQ